MYAFRPKFLSLLLLLRPPRCAPPGNFNRHHFRAFTRANNAFLPTGSNDRGGNTDDIDLSYTRAGNAGMLVYVSAACSEDVMMRCSVALFSRGVFVYHDDIFVVATTTSTSNTTVVYHETSTRTCQGHNDPSLTSSLCM